MTEKKEENNVSRALIPTFSTGTTKFYISPKILIKTQNNTGNIQHDKIFVVREFNSHFSYHLIPDFVYFSNDNDRMDFLAYFGLVTSIIK